MILYLKYRWRLRKSLEQQKKNMDLNDEEIHQARREGKKGEEIRLLEQEAHFEYTEYQDEIDALRTSYLRQKANKLVIPLPSHDDEEMWYRSQFSGDKLLTKKGYHTLFVDIMQRQKDIRDTYIPWIGALTGLLAAATGLLALIAAR
jgi:hypothetical protein